MKKEAKKAKGVYEWEKHLGILLHKKENVISSEENADLKGS